MHAQLVISSILGIPGFRDRDRPITTRSLLPTARSVIFRSSVCIGWFNRSAAALCCTPSFECMRWHVFAADLLFAVGIHSVRGVLAEPTRQQLGYFTKHFCGKDRRPMVRPFRLRRGQIKTMNDDTQTGSNEEVIVLSQREVEVLRLVADGFSNPAIAEHLCLSVETVKTHVRRIMRKLLVDDRTKAAVKALRQGLI